MNGGFAFKSTNFRHEGTRVIRLSDFNENGFVNSKIVRHQYDETLSQIYTSTQMTHVQKYMEFVIAVI